MFPKDPDPIAGQNYCFTMVSPYEPWVKDIKEVQLARRIGGRHVTLLVGAFSSSQPGSSADRFDGVVYSMLCGDKIHNGTVDAWGARYVAKHIGDEAVVKRYLGTTDNSLEKINGYVCMFDIPTLLEISNTNTYLVGEFMEREGRQTYDVDTWNLLSFVESLFKEISEKSRSLPDVAESGVVGILHEYWWNFALTWSRSLGYGTFDR